VGLRFAVRQDLSHCAQQMSAMRVIRPNGRHSDNATCFSITRCRLGTSGQPMASNSELLWKNQRIILRAREFCGGQQH
jgi:hypothetical protein